MVGLVMFWTALVVQPTIDILNKQNVILGKQNEFMVEEGHRTDIAIEIAEWILGNITAIDITDNVTDMQNQLDDIQVQLDILLNMTNSTP